MQMGQLSNNFSELNVSELVVYVFANSKHVSALHVRLSKNHFNVLLPKSTNIHEDNIVGAVAALAMIIIVSSRQ